MGAPSAIMMWLTFAAIVAMIVAYALERWSIEVISVASLVGWLALFWAGPVILGVESPLGPEDILAGFSNQALVTVLALLVVGQGLFHTDALERPTAAIGRLGGRTGMRAVIVVLFVAMVVSAFVNDTPVVVMFLPVVTAIGAARGIATSKILMPLSFAALLGGMTTLIGTSTNLLGAGVAKKYGGLDVGFFDLTIPASAMALVGFVYVAFALPRILRARGGMADQLTGGGGKQFIAQIDVTYGHLLAGASSVAGMFPTLKDMTVRLVQRGEHPFLPPFELLTLRPGDTVIVAATRTALTKAISDQAAAAAATEPVPESTQPVMPTKDVTLAEAVVAPGSRLIGRTIEQAAIHHDTNTLVLGVERRSRMPRMQLADIRLEAGDVLLVGGTRDAIEGLRANRDLLLLEWSAAELPQRRYARRAQVIFTAMVIYAASGIGPIVLGALAAALAMILTGSLNIRQAARAFDRRIYLLIGAALAAATALEATNGAAFIAEAAVAAVAGRPMWVTLSMLFLVVSVMTNVLSNNATVVLFTPVAMGIAARAGGDPLPYVVAVMLASSCAFATPLGYQTNLLVMGPGHYRFRDYLVGGLPLVVLMWLVFSLVGPWYYGL